MHDFSKFPELANSQMPFYYFQSPHKQITTDFEAVVTKVVDGDTIRLKTNFRDFDFPLRFLGTNAKEMSEGGEVARSYLEKILLGEKVYIIIDASQRVGKWGRLLGKVQHRGINMNEHMMMMGLSTTFENRNEGQLPSAEKSLRLSQWF